MMSHDDRSRRAGRLLPVLLFAAGLALVTGCAGKSILTVMRPISVSLDRYRSVAVRVFSQDQANAPEVRQLRDFLIDGIAKGKRFVAFDQTKRSAQRGAHLGLAVAVLAVKRVSEKSRAWLGAFAGRASLKARVRLVELPSRRPLGEALVVGKSSSGSIFAGTTKQAVLQAANQIVRFLGAGLHGRSAAKSTR